MTAGGGDAYLAGGRGNDTLAGRLRSDTLHGGTGADDFHGGGGKDMIGYCDSINGVTVTLDGLDDDGAEEYRRVEVPGFSLGSGWELVSEGDNVRPDIEVVHGGLGNDVLMAARDRPAVLFGHDGNDRLWGGAGNDTLEGGAGHDRLDGGSRRDVLYFAVSIADPDYRFTATESQGSAVTHDLWIDDGSDILHGGPGYDSGMYDRRRNDLRLTLDNVRNDGAAGERDRLIDIEDLAGGDGNDHLVGNDQTNAMHGGSGYDVLQGRGGDDVLATNVDYINRIDTRVSSGGRDPGYSDDGDTIHGGDGNDSIVTIASAGSVLNGGAGDDLIMARTTSPTFDASYMGLFGGDGDDRLLLNALGIKLGIVDGFEAITVSATDQFGGFAKESADELGVLIFWQLPLVAGWNV